MNFRQDTTEPSASYPRTSLPHHPFSGPSRGTCNSSVAEKVSLLLVHVVLQGQPLSVPSTLWFVAQKYIHLSTPGTQARGSWEAV